MHNLGHGSVLEVLPLPTKRMVQSRVDASKNDVELQRAARNGNAKLVERLLAKGARGNAQDVDGWTCLHAAAAEGQLATIQLLAGRDDADLNIETDDGRTALYFAALDGKIECVQELLGKGADPHVRNHEGKSALDVANLFERTQVANVLEDALQLPPPPRKNLVASTGLCKSPVEAAGLDPKLKAKADAYVAPNPQEWKKTDFEKWNKMKDEDWEALEAHQAMEELKMSSEKKEKPAAIPKKASTDPVSGKRRHLPYGRGRIGPPKELTPDHPYYEQYKEWMKMTKDLEASRFSNPASNAKDQLYSLRPESDGGVDPDTRNGSHGVGYTWGQTPNEATVYVRLPAGVGKEEVECEVRPTQLFVAYWTAGKAAGGVAGKRRRHLIFDNDRLWSRVKSEESVWVLEDEGAVLTLTLQKGEGKWWRCITDKEGHPKIDTSKCKGSDLISDYDEDQQKDFQQMFAKTLGR